MGVSLSQLRLVGVAGSRRSWSSLYEQERNSVGVFGSKCMDELMESRQLLPAL